MDVNKPVAASDDRIALTCAWHGPSSITKGQLWCGVVEVLFKNLKTAISIEIPEEIADKQRPLPFTCRRGDATPSHPDVVRISIAHFKSLNSVQAGYFEQTPGNPLKRINQLIPIDTSKLEVGKEYRLVFTTRDARKIEAEFIEEEAEKEKSSKSSSRPSSEPSSSSAAKEAETKEAGTVGQINKLGTKENLDVNKLIFFLRDKLLPVIQDLLKVDFLKLNLSLKKDDYTPTLVFAASLLDVINAMKIDDFNQLIHALGVSRDPMFDSIIQKLDPAKFKGRLYPQEIVVLRVFSFFISQDQLGQIMVKFCEKMAGKSLDEGTKKELSQAFIKKFKLLIA